MKSFLLRLLAFTLVVQAHKQILTKEDVELQRGLQAAVYHVSYRLTVVDHDSFLLSVHPQCKDSTLRKKNIHSYYVENDIQQRVNDHGLKKS